MIKDVKCPYCGSSIINDLSFIFSNPFGGHYDCTHCGKRIKLDWGAINWKFSGFIGIPLMVIAYPLLSGAHFLGRDMYPEHPWMTIFFLPILIWVMIIVTIGNVMGLLIRTYYIVLEGVSKGKDKIMNGK